MKQIKLILVWLWVAVPLGWGVMKSVQKAMPLFTGNGAALAPPGR
jgi:hypothetical protein